MLTLGSNFPTSTPLTTFDEDSSTCEFVPLHTGSPVQDIESIVLSSAMKLTTSTYPAPFLFCYPTTYSNQDQPSSSPNYSQYHQQANESIQRRELTKSCSSSSSCSRCSDISATTRVYIGADKHDESFCPITDSLLVKVEESENAYVFHFDSVTQSMVSHNCYTCANLAEKDLHPLYSVQSSDRNFIIFMKNLKNGAVDQFLFTKTGTLEQVDTLNIKYNPKEVLPSLFIVSSGTEGQVVIVKDEQKKTWKKILYGKERTEIPSFPVKVLMRQGAQKNEGYSNNTRPLCRIRYCPHHQKDIVQLKVSSDVLKFIFDVNACQFKRTECVFCKVRITEYHLVHKYSVFHEESGNSVIHSYNIETGNMEQFFYHYNHMIFEQVYYPEIIYNKDLDTDEIFVKINGEEDKHIVIRKKTEGGFVKFLVTEDECRRVPVANVKTLKM